MPAFVYVRSFQILPTPNSTPTCHAHPHVLRLQLQLAIIYNCMRRTFTESVTCLSTQCSTQIIDFGSWKKLEGNSLCFLLYRLLKPGSGVFLFFQGKKFRDMPDIHVSWQCIIKCFDCQEFNLYTSFSLHIRQFQKGTWRQTMSECKKWVLHLITTKRVQWYKWLCRSLLKPTYYWQLYTVRQSEESE